MNINIFGSTGIIGSKSLDIIRNYFPKLKINLICANNNVKKLINQSKIYSPKYIYINNNNKYLELKNNISNKTKILNFDELQHLLQETRTDFSILAVSGYMSLKYLNSILINSSSVGIVSKEAIVSAGHLFKKFRHNLINKIYPLDSEHFSIFSTLKNSEKKYTLDNLTLTASGGPFLGKKYSSLKNISFKEASNHPKWKMGYKNSIDSATLSNKCLELVEAHYLFDIPFEKLKVIIHPESKVHSIFQYKNYIYNLVAFHNDMSIPIYHFINQKFNYQLIKNEFNFKQNYHLNFNKVYSNQFPIYKFFNDLDKSDPSNIIKFNVANEYAVNSFKKGIIKYTDIFRFITKFTSLNLNYKLNNINDILNYHEILENKINEHNFKFN